MQVRNTEPDSNYEQGKLEIAIGESMHSLAHESEWGDKGVLEKIHYQLGLKIQP